jgi:WD40 repeat protein
MRRDSASLLLLSVFSVCSVVTSSSAAEPTYWQDVRPLLRKHCTVCHSVRTIKEVDVSAGLALDSYAAITKDPKKPIVVRGKAGDSELIKRLLISDASKRMPLDADPLPSETIDVLTRWVNAGAPEGSPTSETAPVAHAPGSDKKRKLDVVLATKFSPPKVLAPKPFPTNSPLELVLPVGPLAPIAAVAYSPDGTHLAVGCYGRVTIWDIVAVRPVKVLTNVLAAVHDLKFSPDGKTLAVAGGQPSARGDLRLFNTDDWSLTATLGGHADVVNSVAFSPDGKRLASASFDKTVRIWDVDKSHTAKVLSGHSDFVYAVAWGPQGDWLASASKDRTVKVVDATTGQSRLTLSGMDQDVLALAVTPDGASIVSSGFESQLYWWNATTGERTRRVTGHDVAVHELCVSHDGKLVASAGADKTLRFWNGSNGQSLRTVQVGSLVYAVALRPDGKQAAAGSFDGLVRLYDPATGKLLVTILAVPGAGEVPEWLALTPEGYVAGSEGWSDRGKWRVAGQPLDGATLWPIVTDPDAVAQLLAGAKLPEPAMKK